LKILCTVPNLGNISSPELSFEEVYPRLRDVRDSETLKVEIVCINPSLPAGIKWEDIKPADHNGRGHYDREDFKSDNPKNRARKRVLDDSNIGTFYTTTFNAKETFRAFEKHDLLRGMIEAIDILHYYIISLHLTRNITR